MIKKALLWQSPRPLPSFAYRGRGQRSQVGAAHGHHASPSQGHGPNWLCRKAESVLSSWRTDENGFCIPCVPVQLDEDSQTSSLKISLDESCFQALGLGRKMAKGDCFTDTNGVSFSVKESGLFAQGHYQENREVECWVYLSPTFQAVDLTFLVTTWPVTHVNQ